MSPDTVIQLAYEQLSRERLAGRSLLIPILRVVSRSTYWESVEEADRCRMLQSEGWEFGIRTALIGYGVCVVLSWSMRHLGKYPTHPSGLFYMEGV